ncbi:MAG: hypothetical protein ACRCSF_04365 [Mycobacteriaceae bacterium]
MREKQRQSKSSWLRRFVVPLAAVSMVAATGGLVAGVASAGPAEECQAVRDRDHAIYLQLVASLPPGSPVPPEIINPCLEAPSQTPTTMAPPTFDTPTPGQTSGGIGYGADIPHTGTLTITMPPTPGVSTSPGQPPAPLTQSSQSPSSVKETTPAPATQSEGTVAPGAINSEIEKPSNLPVAAETADITYQNLNKDSMSEGNRDPYNFWAPDGCADGFHRNNYGFGDCFPDYDYNIVDSTVIQRSVRMPNDAPVGSCQVVEGGACKITNTQTISVTNTLTRGTEFTNEAGISVDGLSAKATATVTQQTSIAVQSLNSQAVECSAPASALGPAKTMNAYPLYNVVSYYIEKYNTQTRKVVDRKQFFMYVPTGISCLP